MGVITETLSGTFCSSMWAFLNISEQKLKVQIFIFRDNLENYSLSRREEELKEKFSPSYTIKLPSKANILRLVSILRLEQN